MKQGKSFLGTEEKYKFLSTVLILKIHTLIRIKTLLVFDKLNLIDFKLGVGIVETMRKEILNTQTTTATGRITSDGENENLVPRISMPKGNE